ncbi:Retinol dehydrogenase [Lasiodiplodia theobromae]|uniref:Retinol dehydrogenase n=1 Tax=Lasiodiplodia theobromae TaxID=45133 RepID=UPI0015C32112|nr:Retinol dehydrogenase [Lasiodiplodia theobromae]KAF4540639.1 Retinol dehydrogenase [Lasiodiplodia theobromae]
MSSAPTFNSETTATQVADAFSDSIRGRNILITGVGPNGLAETLVHTLAAHSPALLILAGRQPAKVSAVADAVKAAHPGTQTRTLQLDLASLASVREAAAHVTEPLHLIINNAGVMNIPTRTLTADGFEMHFAVNYLGAFLFTNLLVPRLVQGARVVMVVSNGYALSPVRFSDYNFDGRDSLPDDELPNKQACEAFGIPYGLGYVPPLAYGQSKTAGILYTKELAKRLKASGVTATCVNPGPVDTDLWRQMPKEAVEQMFAVLPMRSKEQGVADFLVAALHPNLSDGAYVENCHDTDVMPFAKDETLSHRLWELSEQLVKEKFDF